MSKYIVNVKEIVIQQVEIEADSKEDAIMKVREGDGNYLDPPESIETLDPEDWSVYEIPRRRKDEN